MRILFHNNSLKKKLMGMMLLTSSSLLMAASLVFVINEAISYRQTMREELISLADIIGRNAASALLFSDPDSAARTIESVSANNAIRAVCLIDRDHRVFAQYHKKGTGRSFWKTGTAEAGGIAADQIPQLLAVAREDLHSYWNWDMRMDIARDITAGGKTVGTVIVAADMNGLNRKLQAFTALVAVILVLFSAMAYVIALRLQTVISMPIIHLAETMKTVSLKKDFAVRVEKFADDEIGSLFDSFNAMLSEIKDRDELLSERQERLQQLAHFDNLTHLPNRALFHDRLTQALLRAERYHQQVAVMFIDLDGFKDINDTYGHRVGDLVLVQVAARLKDVIRTCDTVARMGGDEFTVFMQNIKTPENAGMVAQKINTALALPYPALGKELFASASIGIALYPDDGSTTDALLRSADVAMYYAKHHGKNMLKFYAKELDSQLSLQLELQNGLRDALENNEFEVHYQPLVAVDCGRIIGMEALVRWRHPEKGLIMPDVFIAAAETSDLIHGLGKMVLHDACSRIKSLHDQGFPFLRLAVNVSPFQFQHHDFLQIVDEVLRQTSFNPTCLELEVTEGAIMLDVEASIKTMTLLKRRGIRISIDDFGIGYSSLNYLRLFPIDTLKIDRSFVNNMVTINDDLAIVGTIIAMAHSLRLEVIAEGVETEEQMLLLGHLGCQLMQGYLFGKPRPSECLPEVLAGPLRGILPTAEDMTKTVLVVDDDALARAMVSTILTGQGYRVVTARDGIEGYREVITHKPQVIISDKVMPHSDGFTFFNALTAIPEMRTIPVILISAKMSPEEEAEALEMGFFDFIAKPINSTILVARVKRAFRFYNQKQGPEV